LSLYDNPLTELPPLPDTIQYLSLENCRLTHIDRLPAEVDWFNCDNNLLECCRRCRPSSTCSRVPTTA